MFNNKAILDFIDKVSWQLDNKNKKHTKKQRASNPQKCLLPYLVKVSQQGLTGTYILSEDTRN